MGWEPKPEAACKHPQRPTTPQRSDWGRVWCCDDCGERFVVLVTDFEPRDINPGELSYDVRWAKA